MKILYYIHERKGHDIKSDYLDVLLSSLSGKCDTYVVARTDDFKLTLFDENPDVVHIIGLWDRIAFKLMRAAIDKQLAVVISPLGALDAYTLKHEQHVEKSVLLADYQRWMIEHADALLASNGFEQSDLLSLKWQRNIDVIASPLLNSSVTEDSFGDSLQAFYNKVMDTRYQLALTNDEKVAIRTLVRVGMSHKEKRTLVSSERLLAMRSLKPEEWRLIFMYGDDEGLRVIYDNAVEIMHLMPPQIDTSAISRYAPQLPKDTESLERSRILEKSRKLRKKLEETTGSDSNDMKELAIMLINSRYLIRKHTFSMRHLAELYEKIKYCDYDEDRFVDVSKSLGVHKFMQRMLQLMKNEFELEEGFMPDKPVDDAGTKKMQVLLLN